MTKTKQNYNKYFKFHILLYCWFRFLWLPLKTGNFQSQKTERNCMRFHTTKKQDRFMRFYREQNNSGITIHYSHFQNYN